ncbi:unnamed protein product [Cunninghamella blakesleeana]
MYSNPIVQAATTKEDIDKCMEVRLAVFVDEQKYPLHTETEDEYNDTSDYWLATCEKTINGNIKRVPVGTVRLITVSGKIAKLGRLAVLSDCRGMYLGRQLVNTLVKDASDRGMEHVVIHAQIDKRGFYEKLGFVNEKEDEEPFLEDGTPHIKMWLRNIHQK